MKRLRRIIAIATTSLSAYCGAKGSPQPPISTQPPAAEAPSSPPDGGSAP
jgi:hypothetical protein